MTALDVSGRVNALVQRYLELGTDDPLADTLRLDDLGADELDVHALVTELEDEFDIDLGWLDHDGLTVDELAEAVNHEVNRQWRIVSSEAGGTGST